MLCIRLQPLARPQTRWEGVAAPRRPRGGDELVLTIKERTRSKMNHGFTELVIPRDGPIPYLVPGLYCLPPRIPGTMTSPLLGGSLSRS